MGNCIKRNRYKAIYAALFGVILIDQSAAADNGTTSMRLEEIIVTAQKRQESLQDVGIAVTAFSGDEIKKLKLTTSVEVAAQTPNLNINQAFANSVPQIFIRGVGLKDPNANATGAVGIYVDDVNLVSPMALTFQLFDIDRVEVLKGPQGTLYGRNTTGGAVKFIATKPTEELEGYLRAGFGNYSSFQFEGAVSGQLTDNLNGRISVVSNQADGFHDNRVTGNDLGDTDALALRALFDWQVSDNVDVLLNIHGGRTDSSSVPFEHSGRVDLAGNPCDPRAATCYDFLGYRDNDNDIYDHDIDFEGKTELDNAGASLEVNLDFKGFQVTSISAYENSKRKHREDADASPNNVLNTYWDDENKQFSQDLRISSNSESALSWIVGGFYSKEENDISNQYDFFRGFRELVESEDPIAFPGGFDPDGVNSLGVTPFYVDQWFSQEGESYAFFAHSKWDFSDRFSLIAGIRYTKEEREMEQITAFVEPTFALPIVPFYSDDKDFDNLSGKLGIEFKPNEDWLFYGNVSTGFKSGGYNGALVFDTASLKPFDEETLTSYEVGFKSTLLGGRARLNVAAFHYKYEDMQLFTFASVGGLPVQVLDNAGESSITGFEAELDLLLTERLDIRLGLGLLDTELDKYDTAISGGDLSGNELVLSPEVSFNGRVRYEWPLKELGTLALQTDFNYQDDIFLTPDNSTLLSQESYWLWNARVSFTSIHERWNISGWIKNIEDKEYLAEAYDFSSNGWDLLIHGTPQTYGVDITFSF